jgi:hypothetical protein
MNVIFIEGGKNISPITEPGLCYQISTACFRSFASRLVIFVFYFCERIKSSFFTASIGAKLLDKTAQSSTSDTAKKRYISTTLHLLTWYTDELKPGSK